MTSSTHEDFAASRRIGYVERPEELRALNDFARPAGTAAESNVLLVTGDSGSGKSSLLAYWTHDHRKRNPDAFIFEHYVGCTGTSIDHVEIVRRLVVAVRDRYQVREEVPTSRARLEEDLPLWLGYVQAENLLIVLDGLDQLESGSRTLEWLPEYLQPRVRLIVSSRDPEQCSLLRARGCTGVEVQPLSRSDRVAIARQHIRSRSSTIAHAVLHRVASAPASANPLFLRTSLEAVRGHASRDGTDERIDYYLAATGIDDLYHRLLVRLDGEYGSELVGGVLRLVRASRRGISRGDLAGLLEHPPELEALLQRLEFFLAERRGTLALLHDELRRAVHARYLPAGGEDAVMHLRLASYFEGATDDPERTAEFVWQLSRAGARERMAEVLSDLCVFHALYGQDQGLELMGYLIELGAAFDADVVYPATFRQRVEDQPECGDLLEVGSELGAFLLLGYSPTVAVDVLTSVAALVDERGDAGVVRIRVYRALGEARRASGDLTGAERDLMAALDAIESMEPVPYEEAIRCRCAVAELLHSRADLSAAERLLQETARLAEQWFGPAHIEVGRVLADLGAVECGLGRDAEGEQTLRQALEISERYLGPDHPQTAQAINNLAAALTTQGRAKEAVSHLERAADINRRVLGPHNAEYATNLANLGMVRRRSHDFGGAAEAYEQAISILRASGRGNDLRMVRMLCNFGIVLMFEKRTDDGCRTFSEAFDIATSALGPSHFETLWAQRLLMLAKWAIGELSTAESIARDTLVHLSVHTELDEWRTRTQNDLQRIVSGEVVGFTSPDWLTFPSAK